MHPVPTLRSSVAGAIFEANFSKRGEIHAIHRGLTNGEQNRAITLPTEEIKARITRRKSTTLATWKAAGPSSWPIAYRYTAARTARNFPNRKPVLLTNVSICFHVVFTSTFRRKSNARDNFGVTRCLKSDCASRHSYETPGTLGDEQREKPSNCASTFASKGITEQ